MLRSSDHPPSFGVLASQANDNIYSFGLPGFIFTSPWVVTQNVVRHYATILISTSYDPIEITVNGYRLRANAIVVSPLLMRNIDARNVGLISVNVSPLDLSYTAFRQFNAIGVTPLERQCYADMDDQLLLAYQGKLLLPGCNDLYRKIIEKTTEQLPFSGRSDTHFRQLLHILETQPVSSLSEIAKRLGLSHSRTTHLFTSSIGLSLKSYLYWRKIAFAGEMLPAQDSLTDIAHNSGFSDSAHLSRTWKNKFGMSPSYARNDVQNWFDSSVMSI